jgi:hypothetical protein
VRDRVLLKAEPAVSLVFIRTNKLALNSELRNFFKMADANSRVNHMKRHDRRKWRALRNRAVRETDPKRALDMFFALDRKIVELSMSVYNIPRPERFKMREQNRRLHQAVKEHVELTRRAL